MKNLIAKIRNKLMGATPDSSRVYLIEYTGGKNLPLPELILVALHKLPSFGPITQGDDNLAILAIGYLLIKIPDSDPRKSDIVRLFDDVSSRAVNVK